jgi:hypothetical protein
VKKQDYLVGDEYLVAFYVLGALTAFAPFGW